MWFTLLAALLHFGWKNLLGLFAYETMTSRHFRHSGIAKLTTPLHPYYLCICQSPSCLGHQFQILGKLEFFLPHYGAVNQTDSS